MATEMINGRDAIKMLKEIFGIEQTCVSSITVTASVMDATVVDIKAYAKDSTNDIEVERESETRYIVDIKKVTHGNDNC